jgi:hypothetical protein
VYNLDDKYCCAHEYVRFGHSAGDVDTLGMMADLQVTLGNLEEASKLYDEVIVAVRNEVDAEPITSWDC